MPNDGRVASSFRDPSGFVFYRDNSVYRQVNDTYKVNYDCLVGSGLYESLVAAGLLIPHEEVDLAYARADSAYKVLKPEMIPFVSYPYEWCFSQLKDAALATIQIQKKALDFGMILKDASAYNVQFLRGRPILVDSLSFEEYREGQIWFAYRQFCQHFLAPLALMSYKDIRLSQLLRIYTDGVPLDLASSLLPFRTWLRFPLLVHIHAHARSQKRFAGKHLTVGERKVSRIALLGLVDSLESAIEKMEWQIGDTEWANYYEATNYTSEAFHHKRLVVTEFLLEAAPASVWDLGANTGVFSRIASNRGIPTVSFDLDPSSVETIYRASLDKGEESILPLVLDLTNPSPGIGWENRERISVLERGPADTVLALALVHHLAIANNLPFDRIAGFLSRICQSLIIEFVPKIDSQVKRLLSTREDIFPGYTQERFEETFDQHFVIERSTKIRGSERVLYLMRRR
jgi:ribosomal protein L11 methylase PrmA